MSKTVSLFHIVFNTKFRKPTIPMTNRRELYAYIFGVIKNNNCRLLRINGTVNHIHLLVNLSPSIALADFVALIKRSSSIWLKSNPNFKNFDGWGREYFATSISMSESPGVIEYIKNQEEHHFGVTYEDELKIHISSAGMTWDEHCLT